MYWSKIFVEIYTEKLNRLKGIRLKYTKKINTKKLL